MKRATIQRRYDFEAAHRLPYVADGHKCKNMHGHSYEVVVQVTGTIQESGPARGMVIDFAVLDAAAARMRETVDHSTLNTTWHDNPTVENMVSLIWDHFWTCLLVDAKNLDEAIRLKVWLYEGPRSCAIYPPEES